jgi:hypothetical protein
LLGLPLGVWPLPLCAVRSATGLSPSRVHEPLEIEKIERRSAFQNELSAEEGMLAEFGEQFAQARDFLEIVGWKIRVACASFVICATLNFTCAPSLRWKAVEGS